MVNQSALAVLAAHLMGLAAAGTTTWSGSFNDLTVDTLADWSWSNQVGPYQWYIFGTGETSEYVNLDAAFANPDDSSSSKGAKISLTSTAYWNGQTMRRTELIPQLADASTIVSGTQFYHFSMKREDVNAPSVTREHQIAFFESHFTELMYGLSGDNTLGWYTDKTEQWSVALDAGVWHNFAYEIDFDALTVGLWHSTGGDALTQVVAPVAAAVSSNGADWHVGVLELPVAGEADADEDLFFSGVYIETGDITTALSGSSGSDDAAAPVQPPAVGVTPTPSAPALSSANPATTSLPPVTTGCTKTKTVWVTASAY